MKKIKNISIAFVSISIGMVSMYSIMKKQLHLISEMSDKHLALFRMMAQWVKIKQEGKNISDYLLKEGYREVAVYGMCYAGERLVNELDNTDIHVKYGIDKNADSIYSKIEIITVEDVKHVDAIIVTAITFFDEISEQLRKHIDCPIISLENILYKI